MDSALLLRIQFGLAIGLHYLFPVATIGLATQILFFQALGYFRQNQAYTRISAWLTAIFAPLFVCGVAWSSAKVPVDMVGRISRIQKRVALVTSATVAAWTIVVAITLPSALLKPLFWIGIALTAAGIAAVMVKPLSKRLPVPLCSGIATAGAIVAALSAHFPSIIRVPPSVGESLTAASSSSISALLGTVVPFAAVWILFIAAFTLFVYRTFKGSVTGEEHGY
jgi:cytochrome bd-type quinol oxidase subunit 1